MKNVINSLIWVAQLFVIIAVAYILFRYFTRPETVITADMFKKVAQENGYTVKKIRKPAVTNYLEAKKGEITIFYFSFRTLEEAREYYDNFVNRYEDTRHTVKLSRDLRLKGLSAEKMSFVNEFRFYIGIYAKDSVMVTDCLKKYEEDVNKVYKQLFQTTQFDFMTMSGKVPEAVNENKDKKSNKK